MKKNKNITSISTSLLYVAAVAIPNIIGFITLPIYSSVLTPGDYGLISYTNSYTNFIATLSSLCLNIYFLRNYSSAKDKKFFTGAMFGNLIIWNVILFILESIIFSLAFYFANVQVPFYPYMFLTLLNSFFISFEIIPLRYFRIRGEAVKYFVRMVSKSLMTVALMIYFLFVARIGVMSRFYSNLIPSIIFAVVFIIYMKKNTEISIDKGIMKEGLKFSLPFVPSEMVSQFSNLFLNSTILNLISINYLGIYSIGTTMASVIGVISSALIMTFETDVYLAAEKEDFAKILVRVKNISFAVMLAVSLAGGMLVREVSMIFLSEKYWEAWPIVQILSLAYPIEILTSIYYNINVIEKHRFAPLISKIVALISQIVICFVLFSVMGDSAFGWSVVSKSFVAWLVLVLCSNKKAKYGMKIGRDVFLLGSMYCLMQLSNLLNPMGFIISVFGKIIIFIIAVVILMWVYEINLKELVIKLLRK